MSRITAFFRGWTTGLLIGVGLAWLLAPARGEETRQRLQEALRAAWEDLRKAAEAEQQRLEAELKRLRGEG